MTDKSKSDFADIFGPALSVALGAAIPAITSAIAGGAPAEIVGAAMVAAAHDVALRRIEARTHEHPSPLSLEARKIEDRAVVLEAMGQPLAADDLHRVAKELRKRAAATAPTDPAPRDDEPTR